MALVVRRDVVLVAGDSGVVNWRDYSTGLVDETLRDDDNNPADPIEVNAFVIAAAGVRGHLTVTATATTVRVQSSSGADVSTVRVIGSRAHTIIR